jgi:cell division protein FtsL
MARVIIWGSLLCVVVVGVVLVSLASTASSLQRDITVLRAHMQEQSLRCSDIEMRANQHIQQAQEAKVCVGEGKCSL